MEGFPGTKKDVVKNEKRPETWLNMNREQAFQLQVTHFEKLTDEAVRDAFIAIFNPGIPEGKSLLTPEELKSLSYRTIVSRGASEVASVEIKRPVFYFGSISEFQNFYEKLFGHRGSNGFHLPGTAFGEDAGIWNETGIMITTNNMSAVAHEIRHTIDPHVENRTGVHNMISEAFAYYQEGVLDVESGAVKLGDPAVGPWPRMASMLTANIYYDQYVRTEDGREKMTYGEFRQLGAALVSAIQAMHERMGALEAQRVLIQATTIEQILAYK